MQSNKPTFKTRTLKLLVLMLIAAVTAALWLDFRKNPKQMIQRALAIKLPQSATHIMVYYYWMPDSKIINMWAVMDVPLEGAQMLAHDLDLPLAQPGNSISPQIQILRIQSRLGGMLLKKMMLQQFLPNG